MSDNVAHQSKFLYTSIWTHEMDSVLLGSMIKSKVAAGCEGSVFPSQFIAEAKGAFEKELRLAFEWYDLVDRLHFLEKRYTTFNEVVALEGTYWNPANNVVIVTSPNWLQALEVSITPYIFNVLQGVLFLMYPLVFLKRNPLLGAYYRVGDPVYNQLDALFGLKVPTQEQEDTVIVLSDSQTQDLVRKGKEMMPPPAVEYGEVSSNQPVSFARRKLVFGEGSPLDWESTNKKAISYYVPDTKGKRERKVEEKGSRVLPRPLPPNSPTLAYSCASNSPRMKWRVPGKPNI